MKKKYYYIVGSLALSSIYLLNAAYAQPVYRTIKQSNVPESNISELSALEYEMRVFEKKADMMLQKIDDLVNEIEFLRAKNNEYIKLNAAKEDEIYNLQKQLSDLETAHSDITKAIAAYSSQIGSLKLAVADKEKEIAGLNEKLLSKNQAGQRKIEILEEELATQAKKVQNDLAAKDSVIADKQREIASLQEKYAVLEKENQKNIAALSAVTQTLDTRDKENSVLRKQLGKQKDTFAEENRSLKENSQQKTKQAQALEKELAKYKKENLVYLKTVDNLKAKLSQRQKEAAALQKKLYQQKQASSRLDSQDAKDVARQALQSDHQELQQQIERYRQAIKEREKEIETKDKSIALLQNQIAGKSDQSAVSKDSLDKVLAAKDARLADLQAELDKYRTGSSEHVKTTSQMQEKLTSREDELFALQKKFLAIKNELASLKADKNVKVENVKEKDKQIETLRKQLEILQSRFETAIVDYKKKIERTESELLTAKKALSQKVIASQSQAYDEASGDEKEKELRFLHNKLQQARLSHQELSIELKKQKDAYEKQIALLEQQLKNNAVTAQSAAGESKPSVTTQPIAEPDDKINDKLQRIQAIFNEAFKADINDSKIKLKTEKGNLVISVFTDNLFDSGKAEIRFSSIPLLNKFGKVFNDQAADYKVIVEGHTDNQPIQYSEWKSNWELSSARALSVLHYFINECGIASSRLSMCGFGEFKPVADNITEAGRQKNRRVELILTP